MINVNRLKKDEILWMYNHYCRHRHRYLDHLNCFVVEKPDTSPVHERVGYLDIETTGLNANFDYIISYAILTNDEEMIGRALKPKECRNWKVLDKNLCREFSDVVKDFDRLVVYWGKDRRHDLPFLRTRVVKWKYKFPLYREVFVSDTYDLVKAKLKLHRNRLENACDFFGIPSKGHRLDAEMWQRARLGDTHALSHVWEHNKEDVISLKAVHELLEEFSAQRKLSI